NWRTHREVMVCWDPQTPQSITTNRFIGGWGFEKFCRFIISGGVTLWFVLPWLGPFFLSLIFSFQWWEILSMVNGHSRKTRVKPPMNLSKLFSRGPIRSPLGFCGGGLRYE